MADFIGSTSGLLRFVQSDASQQFIVATESGILLEMKKRAPEETLIAAPPDGNCACNECPFMRLNTPEKVYLALRDLEPRLEMSEELRVRAEKPIQRMLELSA
jgi:quinolinate synthase